MKTQATASDPSLNISNKRIQPRLAYHLHLHRTVMRCSLAIQKNGLMTLSEDQERAMCILIHIFSEQLKDSAHEAESGKSLIVVVIELHLPSCQLTLSYQIMIVFFLLLLKYNASPSFSSNSTPRFMKRAWCLCTQSPVTLYALPKPWTPNAAFYPLHPRMLDLVR